MHVLTVDDSRASRLVIGKFMAALGFRVTEAAEATEGLRILQRGSKFDVLLVDWDLPALRRRYRQGSK